MNGNKNTHFLGSVPALCECQKMEKGTSFSGQSVATNPRNVPVYSSHKYKENE